PGADRARPRRRRALAAPRPPVSAAAPRRRAEVHGRLRAARRAAARSHSRGRRRRTPRRRPGFLSPGKTLRGMRILVPGGAGYVGSVSVEHLAGKGHDVVVLDSYASARPGANLAGATVVRGTYTDRAAVAALLRGERIEAVLHCGARSLVGESIREPALYFRENVAGGIALLEGMRDAAVERLVISSTAAVYGVPDAIPIPEDAPLRPINPYGETKRSLEAAADWFARAYGLRAASLR